MKQISQNYKSGAIRLEQVTHPAIKSGGVMVQTLFSVISAGTEGMKVREGKMNYLQKAKARPDQVKKVIQSVQQQGLKATYEKVMNKLDSLTPLGYSLSGRVIEVGRGAEEFSVGQLVACAGGGYANHAEVNYIPKNLVVPVPNNISIEHAAFATIGAIAMQGYRQAKMQLGETACVIGLGLIGQILVQILNAAGIKVMGVDISEERCRLAQDCGAVFTGTNENSALIQHIKQMTQGAGVDCIFITAGGKSNQPVEMAVAMARDRARVVDVGITRLDLSWKDYYEKELEVVFSRSYGPGRYDPNYEERGIDYPIGYVRWTERRNMQAFLDLLSSRKIDLTPIVSAIFPFDEAEKVYLDMAAGTLEGLGVLFQYPDKPIETQSRLIIKTDTLTPKTTDEVRLGVIGAGNYASSMLLPHLGAIKNVQLIEVATATSLSAKNAARKFSFARLSSDYQALLQAEDIDTVLIATRHKAHSSMTAEALIAGKAVFVEKPLAIDFEGLDLVQKAITKTGNNRLQVGFNRRFSPAVTTMKKLLGPNKSPMVMTYRVHAGPMESGSWYLDPEQGSRFIGEAGHFLDVFAYLTESRPVSVTSKSLRPEKPTLDDLENLSVVVQYADGSIGNLLYLTQGGIKVPKEFLEVYTSGRTLQMHNFEYLMIFEGNSAKKIKLGGLDKGQKAEIQAFVKALQAGAPMPFTVQELFDTTMLTLCAWEATSSGQVIQI
ncbi:MAG: bi-domain-containing oxidoreductase [Proteobacteria bacterium]|nr:bi-domain-containing oxidoreductase [Pseudomonadota bacterium]MBU1585898.1 bi-domain-containing oxidoreductase [Pseudomonadota bacterium]MBU2627100.1 bi-domain-containing oxidoreductase [Pseudomonadota bacterium]